MWKWRCFQQDEEAFSMTVKLQSLRSFVWSSNRQQAEADEDQQDAGAAHRGVEEHEQQGPGVGAEEGEVPVQSDGGGDRGLEEAPHHHELAGLHGLQQLDHAGEQREQQPRHEGQQEA